MTRAERHQQLAAKENDAVESSSAEKENTIASSAPATREHNLLEKESKSDEHSISEDTLSKGDDKYIEAAPAGYCYPLLSAFAERELDMRLQFSKAPSNMTLEENLLRTLEEVTRPEVRNGKRTRKNPVARLRKSKRDRLQRKIYLYDINHPRRKVKGVRQVVGYDASGGRGGIWAEKPPVRQKTWIDFNDSAKQKLDEKAKFLIEQLHEEQLEEARRVKMVDAISDPEHRSEMKAYHVMASAKKQDLLFDHCARQEWYPSRRKLPCKAIRADGQSLAKRLK